MARGVDYTPMHFMWGVKSGATQDVNWSTTTSDFLPVSAHAVINSLNKIILTALYYILL